MKKEEANDVVQYIVPILEDWVFRARTIKLMLRPKKTAAGAAMCGFRKNLRDYRSLRKI